MLAIVVWLALYAVLLSFLGWAAGKVPERRWFKLLFCPGVLAAALLQVPAALLAVGRGFRLSLFAEGRRSFELARPSVPVLAGVAFLLVSHATFYSAFALAVTRAESAGLLDARGAYLPEIDAQEVLAGTVELEAGDYARSLGAYLETACSRPLPYLVLLYLLAPAFVSLGFRTRECLWASVLVLVLGLIASFGDWLGIGFPFLSRGWWAGWFRFPEWWRLFSFYVTALLATLVLCLSPRAVRVFLRVAAALGFDSGGEKDRARNTRRRKRSAVGASR